MSTGLSQSNLFEFFASAIQAAMLDQRVPLSANAARYLSDLLVRLSRTELLYREDAPDTLAELHLKAQHRPRADAIAHYRYLGDKALYVAGFFSDSLNRQAVGMDYYAQMGAAAYQQVAGLTQHNLTDRGLLSELYTELAHRYRACLGLLAQVADQGQGERPGELVRLYERWAVTHDPHAMRRLIAHGVLPARAIAE